MASLAAFGSSSVVHAAAQGTSMPFDTPHENVRTMARLTASLAGDGIGYVRYTGKAFGLLEDGSNLPLYDIDGIGALRALPEPNGVFKFLFSEFALYLDPATGLPLESWTNPAGRKVEVWHQRNGPVNYEISPAKAMLGNFARADGQKVEGFQLPWRLHGPFASFALDAVANRKNPLDPQQWPLESSGPTIPTTEHSQYTMLRRDLENKRLLSLPFVASLQSLKPWHPWMLMGQRPGKVFTRMTAHKVAGPQVLPAPLLKYAQQNLAAFLAPPASWTGQYVTAHTIYKEGRSPAR
jgi:hypothetical protein